MIQAVPRLAVVWLALAFATAELAHVASAQTLSPDSNRAMVVAAKSGDKAVIQNLLQGGADANATDPDGTTALHWAAHRSDADTVELLLAAGANANATNEYGVTPLFLACTSGQELVVTKLVKAGAKWDARVGGETALVTAARTGNLDAVKALLAHGADPNTTESTNGQTALMQAVAEAHAAVAGLLVEKGADIHVRSKFGFTALAFAVRAGDLASTQLLVEAGAKVNEPLKADSVRMDSSGREGTSNTTLLVMSLVNAHYEVAKYLLDRGADPNADIDGRTALHALVQTMNWEGLGPPDSEITGSGNLGAREVMKALLAAGADPNARMAKERGSHSYNLDTFVGATPFWFAAKAGDVKTMRSLYDQGALPDIPNAQGTTPLMVAAGVGFVDGVTAGSEAAAIEAVKLALELGNDLDTVQGTAPECVPRNYDSHAAGRVCGWTALHGAASRGADSIVRFLIEKGARLDIKDKAGKTPQQVAAFSSLVASPYVRESTAELLKKAASERAAARER